MLHPRGKPEEEGEGEEEEDEEEAEKDDDDDDDDDENRVSTRGLENRDETRRDDMNLC